MRKGRKGEGRKNNKGKERKKEWNEIKRKKKNGDIDEGGVRRMRIEEKRIDIEEKNR